MAYSLYDAAVTPCAQQLGALAGMIDKAASHCAANKIEETLRAFAPDADISFMRLAVLPDQIAAWHLPTRPTKATDSRAKGFGTISVELDAIAAPRLRQIVREAIERHLPTERLAVLKAAEESERELLRAWASASGGPA